GNKRHLGTNFNGVTLSGPRDYRYSDFHVLAGGKGSWGVAYKKALDAFKKFKMSKYSSYTDSEAKDTAKAFHLLIEQNA
ncbi:hypothetical protein C6Y13_06470, partial [Lactiplantibacillus pentosus]|uniref:hypothetical protein n=1 Tax=Lactiplantibacillus pentosus TaxID=1589 RepID=UPI000D4D0DAF